MQKDMKLMIGKCTWHFTWQNSNDYFIRKRSKSKGNGEMYNSNLHACIYIAGLISNENIILSKGK